MYLRKDHPYAAPYVYVVPTAGMSLSPSRHMDARGMVYLPYLNEWKQVSHLYNNYSQFVNGVFDKVLWHSKVPYGTQSYEIWATLVQW